MNCPKCNAQLPDGAKFCATCGTPQPEVAAPVINQPVQPPVQPVQPPVQPVQPPVQPVQPPVQPVQPPVQLEQRPQFVYDEQPTQPPVQPQQPLQPPVQPQNGAPETQGEKVYYEYGKEFSNTKYNKKKRRRRLFAIIIPLAVIAAVAAVVLINLQSIVGLWKRHLSTPEEYLLFAEGKSIKDAIGDPAELYASILEGSTADGAASGDISLKLSDDILEMLEDNLGEDFDWVNDLKIAIESTVKGGKQQLSAQVGCDGERIIGGDVYLDGNSAYIGVPELTDEYLFTDELLSGIFTIGDQKIAYEDFIEALPDKKTFKKILDRYSDIILEHLDGTRKSTDSITVDGITEKLVMVEINLERTELRDLVKDIAKALSKDDDIADMLKKIEKLIEDDADLDGEFKRAMQQAVESIEENPMSGVSVIYRSFINSNHEVVGRELRVDDQRIFYYVTTRDKNDFATEMRFGQYLIGSGYGTVKGDVVEGTFTLTNDGKELIVVTIKDFEITDKVTRGTIRVMPAASLIYEFDLPTELAKYDVGLELSFDIAEQQSKFAIYGLMGDKKAVGIVCDFEEKTAKSVKMPNGDTASDPEEWAESFDMDEVISNMEDAGLPESLTEALK